MANLRTDAGNCLQNSRWMVLAALFVVAATANAQQIAPQPPNAGTPGTTAAGPTPDESLAAASPPDKVVDVKIQGNKSLALDKILPSIRTRPGRPFDLELIEEDVRRLDRTHMFVNVQTYWQQVAGGRIVIFDVLERPLLREVLFIGCDKIRKKTLQKESELKVGDPVDPYAIEEARRKLEEFYHKRGFNAARITLLEGDKPEDRRAIFVINEGNKQLVWKDSFTGNTIASDDRLKTQIRSKPPFLFLFKGEMDRKEVDEDIRRLTAYYRDLGFFHARVGCDPEYDEKGKWVTLHFVIDEGPRYKIRDISVVGNTKYTSEELLADLKLKGGEYFNKGKLMSDEGAIRDKYGSIGYVFADAKPESRFLEEPAQLDIVYSVTEGDRYKVGKINVDIRGEYPHTQLTTILNRLSFKPGDIVDIREFRSSEVAIKRSALFENTPSSSPKIVFSPPDQDGEQVAEKPSKPERKRGANVRGQSPDTPSRDRELDVTLDCGRYVGPPTAEPDQAAPAAPPRNDGAGCRGQETRRVESAASNDPMQMAVAYRDALAQHRKQQESPARLIQTQYTSASGQVAPSPQNSRLQWTNPAGAATDNTATANYMAPPAAGTAVASSAPPTAPVPAATSPTYGQIQPRQGGLERAVESPEGSYAPGPIFSESSPFRDGPADGGEMVRPLDLTIRADETMTGKLMFGVGINSDAGLVGSIILDEQNFDWTRPPSSWEDIRNGTGFRGAGQRFRLEAMPGTSVQRYAVNFQEPFMFGTQNSLGLSGFYFNRIYSEYTEQRLGGRIMVGRQFTQSLAGTLAYRGAKINITDPADPALPDFAEVIGRDLALHGFQASLVHDNRDNAFLATQGHLIEGSVEQVLGSFDYPRAELDARKYFTLYERPDGSGRQVLSLSGHAGYTGDNTPIYERFYAGGFSTIRGFSYRGASPRQIGPTTGEDIIVGGNFELLASAEYLFPITADDMLRGVIFCDTGTVEPTVKDWNNKYRVAPGFGLRIVVPAMGQAPIALDFAFPVSWQDGDQQEVFSFFMGFGR